MRSSFPGTRHVAAAILAAALAASAVAAQDDPAHLAARRDQKLAAPFLRCSAWTTDLGQATSAAKATGRLVLGYFTRSYAPCGPCTQLEQTVFSKPEFAEFGRGVVLFCHVSTRLPDDPQGFLFSELGGTAFPTLMVLDGDRRVLARRTGARCVREIRDLVAEGHDFARAIANAASLPGAERAGLLERQVAYGHLAPDEARASAAAIRGLSSDRAAAVEAAIVSRECTLVLLDVRKARDDAGRLEAAKGFVAMKRAGRIPTDGNAPVFWDWVTHHAAHVRDVALFEEGVAALRPIFAGDPAGQERLREKESILDGLRRNVLVGAVEAARER